LTHISRIQLSGHTAHMWVLNDTLIVDLLSDGGDKFDFLAGRQFCLSTALFDELKRRWPALSYPLSVVAVKSAQTNVGGMSECSERHTVVMLSENRGEIEISMSVVRTALWAKSASPGN
jgi:hypothetical protein